MNSQTFFIHTVCVFVFWCACPRFRRISSSAQKQTKRKESKNTQKKNTSRLCAVISDSVAVSFVRKTSGLPADPSDPSVEHRQFVRSVEEFLRRVSRSLKKATRNSALVSVRDHRLFTIREYIYYAYGHLVLCLYRNTCANHAPVRSILCPIPVVYISRELHARRSNAHHIEND